MRHVFLLFVLLVLGACGEQTYDGECVYFSNLHSSVDTDACQAEGEAQECESAEVEDRSTEDETVMACVYSGCALDGNRPDFDCDEFRAL